MVEVHPLAATTCRPWAAPPCIRRPRSLARRSTAACKSRIVGQHDEGGASERASSRGRRGNGGRGITTRAPLAALRETRTRVERCGTRRSSQSGQPVGGRQGGIGSDAPAPPAQGCEGCRQQEDGRQMPSNDAPGGALAPVEPTRSSPIRKPGRDVRRRREVACRSAGASPQPCAPPPPDMRHEHGRQRAPSPRPGRPRTRLSGRLEIEAAQER